MERIADLAMKLQAEVLAATTTTMPLEHYLHLTTQLPHSAVLAAVTIPSLAAATTTRRSEATMLPRLEVQTVLGLLALLGPLRRLQDAAATYVKQDPSLA